MPISASDAAGKGRASSSTGIFRDVAEEAGLTRFRMGHNGRTPLDIRDTAGGGGGFIDYDGDGMLDILLVGERIGLFRNTGGGRFTDVSAQSGLTARGPLMGCAVGDFDNDGRPDVFITGHGIARLYRNTGGEPGQILFRDVTEAAGVGPRGPHDWSTSAGFADLDGDSLLDLAVCHYVLFTPPAMRFCGFKDPQGNELKAACPPFYYEPQKLRVFRNRGAGRFEDVSSRFPAPHGNNLGLAFADFDSDGNMDLYVANDGEPGDLYRNRDGWKFENIGSASGTAYNQDGREQAGMGVDWGDYDNDGKLDLIVATFQDEPRSLYRNAGDGLFSYASFAAGIAGVTLPTLTFGIGFLDYDNDGDLDLMLANGHVQDNIERIHPPLTYAQPLQLFRNTNGTFADAGKDGGPAFARPIVGRALATGDYDNDGKMDVLVVDLEGAPLLLHNESARVEAHWLGVRAVTKAGRDAIGVRVTLEMGDGTKRVAEPHTCRSYQSAADPRVHFGMGAVSRVTRLTVRWHGGRTAVIENPTVDRYITVREGAGPAAK